MAFLDNWNPTVSNKPDYYDTVKYIYKYVEFHISEDEAYVILNTFILKWDASAGQLINEDELVKHVTEELLNNFKVMLTKNKIVRIVQLILSYLHYTGHFYQHEIKTDLRANS